MKILKKSLSVSPLLLLGTVSADTQEVSIVNGEYQTLTNPKDITVSPIEILGRGKHLRSHSNLSVRQWRGLYYGGDDVHNISYEDAIGGATALIRITSPDGSTSVGSGMFVSPNVMITVAHNFLDSQTNDFEEATSRTVWLGSNSTSDLNNWKPTSGVAYSISKSQVHFLDQAHYGIPITPENKHWASHIHFPNDLAVVVFDQPVQFMSPYNRSEFVDLATKADIDQIRDGDSFAMTGYPGSRKKGDANTNRDFDHGRLYQVQSKIVKYTDPATGKPYSGRYSNQFSFHNSSWGGFSGSGVVSHNKVIGVIQKGVHDTAANPIPDSRPEDKENGGLILQDRELSWVKSIVDANKIQGWRTKNGESTRYFFKESGHLARNETLAIDGHSWKFDATGAATDLGVIEKGNVKVKYVDKSGNTLLPETVFINDKVVGTMYSYDVKQDDVLKTSDLITSGRYIIDKVSRNASGKVVKGDTVITVTLKSNVPNLDEVKRVGAEINKLETPTTQNDEITKQLQDKKRELDDLNMKFKNWINSPQTIDKLPQKTVDDELVKARRLLDEYDNLVYQAKNYKIVDIPYSTEEVEDEDLRIGLKKVVTPGVVGKKEIIATRGSVELSQSSTAIKDGDKYTQTITVHNKLNQAHEIKPLDLFLIIDGSGSTNGRKSHGNDTRQIKDVILQDAEKLVQSLPDGSQVMITSYLENKATSYRTNRYTKLLSKADALQVIKDFQTMPQGRDWYTPFENYAKNHPDKFLPDETKEYEDAYSSQSNKNDLVSVVQFTDAWDKDLNETIDTSFAAWAKDHAKTFMSVIYPNGDIMRTDDKTDDLQSINEMKKAGYTNIYNTWGDSDSDRQNQIITKFQNTGVDKKINSTGHVTFALDGNVLSDVELIKPDGTKVTGQRNIESLTQFDQDGKYTLKYRISPNNQTNSHVTATVNINGHDESKTDNFIHKEGSTIERVITQPVNEILHVGVSDTMTEVTTDGIPYDTQYIDDDTLQEGHDVVKVEGVEGVRTTTKTWKTVKGVKKGEPKVDTVVTTPKVDKIVRRGTAGTTTESRLEKIPFTTEIIEDESLPEGVDKVTVEGVEGEREYVTTYKTVKGQKVGEPLSVTNYLTNHVVTKIVHHGVKGSKTEVEDVTVPYQTKYVEDDTLPLGTRKVIQSGENGIRKITRTWITQRKLKVGDPVDVKEAISKEARDEIIHIGTREYVRDENYVSIPNTPVNSDAKSVIGQKGQKLMIDWYAIAKGKRISDVKSNEHLLRMPINEVVGEKTETKVGVGNGFSVRRFSLPPKKIANPAKLVNPYESDITSQALSILRRYKF